MSFGMRPVLEMKLNVWIKNRSSWRRYSDCVWQCKTHVRKLLHTKRQCKTVSFSNYYFQNTDFPVEEAVDTIRHEYAHYMDFVINGKLGHSTSWKQCCIRIGALPTRLYSETRANYHRLKHEKDRQAEYKLEQFSLGTVIDHPRFGRGVILAVTGDGVSRVLQVEFSEYGQKMLGASWVLSNCKTQSVDKER